MTNGGAPSGWYQDPTRQGDARYWNGTSWTESVDRGGAVVSVPIDAALAQTPPVPGTEVSRAAAQAPPPQVVTVSSDRHSPVPAIMGILVLFFVIIVIVAVIVNNDDESSGGDPSGSTPAPTATAEPEQSEDG